jgi:hypothetical protein
VTDIPSLDDDVWIAATRYRAALRKMFDEIRFDTAGCQCNLRDDWADLLDSGVDKRDSRLTEDGRTCIACRCEAIYEEAVGTEIFEAEAVAEIKMRLGDHSVIAQVEDENGALRYTIVEREALESFNEMFDEDEDDLF